MYQPSHRKPDRCPNDKLERMSTPLRFFLWIEKYSPIPNLMKIKLYCTAQYVFVDSRLDSNVDGLCDQANVIVKKLILAQAMS